MKKTFLVFILLILSGLGAKAYPQHAIGVEYGELSKLMTESFRCGTYASFSGRKGSVQTFYEKGLYSGKQFIDAVNSGKISKETWQKTVPIYIGLVLHEGGPSVDFLLGRIFEQATSIATDEVIKRSPSGLMLPENEWRFDSSLQTVAANNLYEANKCWAFIRK